MEFSRMGLDPAILRALDEMGFVKPTPIQEQSLPLLLQGEDLIGQAQTGTGKTAAFAICILERLFAADRGKFVEPNRPHAIVLCPTRELAVQVAGEIERIGKYTGARVVAIYGGQEIERQLAPLSKGADIIVGTPGRVLDHMERGTLYLDKVEVAVLDEADKMLDMGFREDIERILQKTPPSRQTLLFSATLPPEIVELGKKYMNLPQEIRASGDEIAAGNIRQFYVETSKFDKLNALLTLLVQKKPRLALIFCRTKRGADRLNQILLDRGFKSLALHGDMSQNRRDRSMEAFRKSHINILVATDLASRGLDVTNISHVINYDMTEDPYTYTHRIGRTGRMGKDGEAISLVYFDQAHLITMIEKVTGRKIEPLKVEISPQQLPKRVRFEKDKSRRHAHGGKAGGQRRAARASHASRGGSHHSQPREYRSSRGHQYFGRR
ncbi:MAG: DEAD/DEAH box helicase [Candidatus Micrarchaeota archaeon]|nr:DEAD/DEAH box helicase [Candidatus Micrarchaeota archaeon]